MTAEAQKRKAEALHALSLRVDLVDEYGTAAFTEEVIELAANQPPVTVIELAMGEQIRADQALFMLANQRIVDSDGATSYDDALEQVAIENPKLWQLKKEQMTVYPAGGGAAGAL